MHANKQTIREIFTILRAQNPKPTTELIYNSTFELLIAVILSAQATDISVNKATQVLYKIANTPEQIAALGVKKLKPYIKTIGLFNTKAENVIKTCNILISKFNSIVPDTRISLEILPGVGRKTANVILNTAFNQPTMAVDTHIFRMGNRLQIGIGTTPLAVEKNLLQHIPEEFIQDAHHWLILHGRYTCTARNPKCSDCVLRNLCAYRLEHGL